MIRIKKRLAVYVVYTKGDRFVYIYKNIKAICENPKYGFSVHSLYKHNFDENMYINGEYIVARQSIRDFTYEEYERYPGLNN